MPNWFIVVVILALIVGVFVGPFYEALRMRLGLQGGKTRVRVLPASGAEPALLSSKRGPKARK